MFEKYNPQKVEESISKMWEDNKIYEKLKQKMKSRRRYYFLDGPPYATGYIHMGTTLNKVLKDAYIRFFRMQGYNVWDQPGYDTHGTPIEVKVEKLLGFHSKKDIEKYGTEKFIKKCKEFATQHIDEMNKQFWNLGVWMDFSHPYITLNNEYIEGAWHTFKVAYNKELLYKGNYPVHVCPRCQTAVAYNEIEYMKKKDPSVYVKFKLKDEESYLVIWTTTPWTLPANVAIMVNPNFDYVEIQVKDNDEKYIIAEGRLKTFVKKAGIKEYKIIRKFKGKELEGKEYEHPFKDKIPKLQELKKGHIIINSARFVTLDEGTGLVHSAPGHGKEDYQASLPYGLEMIAPLNIDGSYKDEMGELTGKNIEEANNIIITWLKERNALLKVEEVEHDYPKCWRCSTPLILMAVPQWFFKITSIKNKLLEENEKVNWQPTWAKNRFKAWLEGLEDWPISRQRYWGIPLPIWVCDKCGHVEVLGSIEELKNKSGKEIKDLHRPYIDEITWKCEKCEGTMRRIEDVLDAWFASGVASWASLGYPKNKELFEELWPVDLEIEGSDQIRGWWNSQIITSTITFDKKPFNNIILHGLVLDAKGVKMSKSKGNVITPEEAIERYGRDALRLYLLSYPPWNNFYFNWQELEKVSKLLGTYWNIYLYVKTYANINKSIEELEKEIKNIKALEDKWIIARLDELINKRKEVEKLSIHKYLTSVQDFILHDLSRDYIKMIRQRIKRGEENAKKVLYYVMYKLNLLLSISCPYITERVYQDIYNKEGEESIHFLNYPSPSQLEKEEKRETIETMEIIQEIIEATNRERHNKKIKIRWPVEKIYLSLDERVISKIKDNEDLLKRLLNTRKIEYSKREEGEKFKMGHISIDESETEEIKEERFIKEVIRNIQVYRKENKKKVGEKVNIKVFAKDHSKKVIEKYKEEIEENTDSHIIIIKNIDKKDNKEIEYKDLKIIISL